MRDIVWTIFVLLLISNMIFLSFSSAFQFLECARMHNIANKLLLYHINFRIDSKPTDFPHKRVSRYVLSMTEDANMRNTFRVSCDIDWMLWREKMRDIKIKLDIFSSHFQLPHARIKSISASEEKQQPAKLRLGEREKPTWTTTERASVKDEWTDHWT